MFHVRRRSRLSLHVYRPGPPRKQRHQSAAQLILDVHWSAAADRHRAARGGWRNIIISSITFIEQQFHDIIIGNAANPQSGIAQQHCVARATTTAALSATPPTPATWLCTRTWQRSSVLCGLWTFWCSGPATAPRGGGSGQKLKWQNERTGGGRGL